MTNSDTSREDERTHELQQVAIHNRLTDLDAEVVS